jgi:2-oxoisovalerate dehydrogenase E1 component
MSLDFEGNHGVVVVSFGNGATNQGSVHEALVFAIVRKLPVIFICENNGREENTPIFVSFPNSELWKRAQGYEMIAEKVDSEQIADIYSATLRAVERARRGDGTTFLEIKVPRIGGHYNGDIEHYRSAEDRATHSARDPIAKLHVQLIQGELIDGDSLQMLERQITGLTENEKQSARSAPLPEKFYAFGHVVAPSVPVVTQPLPSAGETIAYCLAINRALDHELAARPELPISGVDIAIPAGAFGVTRNLQKM